MNEQQVLNMSEVLDGLLIIGAGIGAFIAAFSVAMLWVGGYL